MMIGAHSWRAWSRAPAWVLGLLLVAIPATAAGQARPQGAPEPPAQERFEKVDHRNQRASADEFSRFRAEARRGGEVRVIIGLQVEFTPEGALPENARNAQRADIARETGVVRRALAGSEHRVVHTYETVPYVAAELSERALERLEAADAAASLQRDSLSRPTLAQSRVIVEANELNSVSRTGVGQAVAILDTGVQKSHPFLAQAGGATKVVSEACYSANSTCPGGVKSSTAPGSGEPCTYAPDGCRHGTHVAGIAAGRGASFSGVARDAKLIAIQVFSRFTSVTDCGAGENPCTLSFDSDQLKGLERVYALRNTFSIGAVNMSLGGGSHSSACDDDALKPAIDNLRAARIPTVIASGNEGFSNSVASPGCISTAVTVGSTDKSDDVSLFSNSGSLVDLFAPGEQINSSVPGNGFAVFDGTSMAAPHVAGAFAILRQTDPAATAAIKQTAFTQTGKPITDEFANPPITRDRIRVLSASANLKHTGFGAAMQFSLNGGGLASNGVGMARRTSANNNPTGASPTNTINLTGIPAGATVKKAWLVWQTVGAPDPNAVLDGVKRYGKLVGASGQFTCWNTNSGGAVRTYRYDIPPGEITGDGLHSIGDIGGANSVTAGRPDGQGASILVVYEDPGAPNTGRAYVRFGAMTARPGAPQASHAFSGLDVPAGTSARALHTAIGDGESFNDPSMMLGGQAVTLANSWSGTDGAYWDDVRRTVSATMVPEGATSIVNSQAATGECLTWPYAALTYRHP